MAYARLGTPDLTLVTDALISLVTTQYNKWPMFDVNGGPIQKFTVTVTGAMPEAVATSGGCHLCLYLMHVRESPHLKNTVLNGFDVQPPQHPLAVELTYLLTARSAANFREEQRAMSIALRALHHTRNLTLTAQLGGVAVPIELQVQMRPDSLDEMSRMWQSFGTPQRLSALYRVSALLITPEAVTTTPAAPPAKVVVAIDPVTDPAASPALHGTAVEHVVSVPVEPYRRPVRQSPATVTAGESFQLLGAGLDTPPAQGVFLTDAAGVTQDVTSWAVTGADATTPVKRLLSVPSTGGPAPGGYALRVGDPAGGWRSAALPLRVGPLVTRPDTGEPVLVPMAGGLYRLDGSGFDGPEPWVSVGGVPLTVVAKTPAAGEARPTATSVTFRLPAGLAAGLHEVRVEVSGVPAVPAWWVRVP